MRFGFDGLKSWKNFQVVVKNKATKTHVGVFISRPITPAGLWYILTIGYWCIRLCYIHLGVEFGVARFDYNGQFPGRLRP